jgi:hypothetical protein
MRLLLILAAAAGLSGCGANYVGRLSTGGAALAPPVVTPAQGGTVVSGPSGLYASVTVSGSVANFLYWFTGAGIYGAMLLDDLGRAGPYFPAMKEDRTIAEVDCSKPIPPDTLGNIRCR